MLSNKKIQKYPIFHVFQISKSYFKFLSVLLIFSTIRCIMFYNGVANIIYHSFIHIIKRAHTNFIHIMYGFTIFTYKIIIGVTFFL